MNFQSKAFLHQQAIQSRCFHPSGEWTEFPRAALEGSIVTRFEEMVARYPDRLAVKMGAESLTYAELNAAANRLAHAILAQRGEGTEPVAFLLEQGVGAIVALLGILKAGKFYVALEPTHPPARLQAILADMGSVLLLVSQQGLPLAGQIASPGQAMLLIDELADALPTVNPALGIAPDSIAYLIYTSGATGVPKGVMETHRNVLHFTRVLTNLYHFCPQDRVALIGSHSISGTPSKVFPALLNGASLLPFAFAQHGVTALSRWLTAEAITYFILAPSIFRQWVALLSNNDSFPHLRILGTGGERLLPADIARYQQHFAPSTIFRNCLALSEVKIVTNYFLDHTTPIPTDVVPVGYCVEETAVFLVDDQGAPVGLGEIGEIVVRGRYLSPGYWRQPELTAARFRPDPDNPDQRLYFTGDLGLLSADGCLLHLGRKDQQVKIRGVRVEISEIEGALWALGGLKEVAVIARPNAQGEPRLVAYLVPTNLPAPTVTSLRRRLAATLPTTLLPEAFVFLEALPLNTNGKVDLRALPDPAGDRPAQEVPYAPPRSALEAWLVDCWEAILAIRPVGIDDNFFDVGGDSLKIMQILTRLQSKVGDLLPYAPFFLLPTIRRYAQYLSRVYPIAMQNSFGISDTRDGVCDIDHSLPSQALTPFSPVFSDDLEQMVGYLETLTEDDATALLNQFRQRSVA